MSRQRMGLLTALEIADFVTGKHAAEETEMTGDLISELLIGRGTKIKVSPIFTLIGIRQRNPFRLEVSARRALLGQIRTRRG